jgi:hypothetical protein
VGVQRLERLAKADVILGWWMIVNVKQTAHRVLRAERVTSSSELQKFERFGGVSKARRQTLRHAYRARQHEWDRHWFQKSQRIFARNRSEDLP